ncbi:hypothetical protein [Streptomyces spirodelae]|uniref:Uncharacterized protein n=1 Tax=Streptomyces spirodelae TaxID=2812904 RepID=A0ABS3X1H6_9ACTN|nr:hypothetical protein [Streptomyces spirodelae]MBO8189222.1 hypothetical protein [Streptomyces spirodelae]
MGNMHYEIYRDGERLDAGYGVEAVCEETGCQEQIDRGLAYLCGSTPGGDEYGCGRYYCGKHLYLGSGAPVSSGLCLRYDARYTAEHPDPLELSPDAMVVEYATTTPGLLSHGVTDRRST